MLALISFCNMPFLRDQPVFLIIYFTLGCVLALKAEKCGGLLEANRGDLEIRPSNSSCLWIIKLQKTGMNLEIKSLTVEAIVVMSVQNNGSSTNLKSTWISGPTNSYQFGGQMFAILAPPRTRRTSVSWTGVNVDDSRVTLNASFVTTSEGTLQWKRLSNGMDQTLWAVQHEATGVFNWTLNSDQPCCGNDNNATQCISFNVINIISDGSIGIINNTCPGSSASVGSLKVEKHSITFVLLHVNSGMGMDSTLQVEWKPVEHLNRNVKGVIVGTKRGLYVVDLEPPRKTMVSLKEIGRVAFDWNSKKMYWVEELVGIMRANVDGSDFEQLIADMSVTGMEIEPITGNLYYSIREKNHAFRVCNNNGKKCSTFAHQKGEYVYGIAFHSSKGLLFWSSSDTTIFRANLDGSNATEIVKRHKTGVVRVDEREDRLYFANSKSGAGGAIMSSDLNGQDVRYLPDISSYSIDLDVAGDKVYFSLYRDGRLLYNTKQGTNLTLIAEQMTNTKHIALFGKLLSSSMPNPCVKAECAHLCVLINTSSYRCLCPDGEKLQEDGVSCD